MPDRDGRRFNVLSVAELVEARQAQPLVLLCESDGQRRMKGRKTLYPDG